MDNNSKKVYIIILNWNGWEDTIECLESIFRNSYPNYNVIVCDNASADNSLGKIKQWATGKIRANHSNNSQISICTTPPVSKPIQYAEYNRKQAEQGGHTEEQAPLILIQNGDNLGFAGGNNVGIRYALARNDFEYVWLLNNDTVINKNALVHLVQKMTNDSHIGICGSTLLYYSMPDTVQALGGAKYNKLLGISRHVGVLTKYNDESLKILETKIKLDYIIGASMLVSKEFLLKIGLMCEDYFLYYEEIDWSIRMQKNYKLAYVRESIVFHKEGSSIGSNVDPKSKSMLSDYYSIRNRIIFTKKYYKWVLPFVYLGLLIVAMNRLKRRQWNRVTMLIRIIIDT